MALSKILTALTAGLALLSVPELAGPITASLGAVGGILTVALQQAPGVANAIWPSGDSNSEIVQISNLASRLGRLDVQISEVLQAGLSTIMNSTDVSTFANFAASGAFSGPDMPSLVDQTEGLDFAFRAYLLTTAMAANDWQAMYGPPYNNSGAFNSKPEAQAKNFVCNLKPSGVCDLIDSKGVAPLCQPENWSEWTSQKSQRNYYANQKHGKNNPSSGPMVNAIFDNKWSSLELVFDGGYNCSMAEGGPGSQPVSTFLSFHPNLDATRAFGPVNLGLWNRAQLSIPFTRLCA